MSSPTPAWLTEVDFDPSTSPNVMGTRALGDRPWLVADDAREEQLALKEKLCTERHGEVFAALPGAEVAAGSVAVLIQQAGLAVHDDDALHPLDRAGRSIQEDLCLMHRRPDGWYLVAASLCFPSRWTLAHKIDKHITEVHAPVRGYREDLAQRVDRLFDRLTERPVWRRNWFVHPDPNLFQPTRPAHEDVVMAPDTFGSLFLRSERQTLRAINPKGWILFTIKTQQMSVGTLAADKTHRANLGSYLAQAPQGDLSRRGLNPAQTAQLASALDTR